MSDRFRRRLVAHLIVALGVCAGCEDKSDGGGGGAKVGGVDASFPDAGDAGAYTTPGWNLFAMRAVFTATTYSTEYYADIYLESKSRLSELPALTASWSLSLQLIDPAGAPDPSTPGSGAAVDVGCTNAGVGTPNPQVNTVVDASQQTNDTFTWTHPDPADSTPPGKYGCDHLDQGPSGHQGLITVVVSDGTWQCTASYKGTHDSDTSPASNASTPVCKKM